MLNAVLFIGWWTPGSSLFSPTSSDGLMVTRWLWVGKLATGGFCLDLLHSLRLQVQLRLGNNYLLMECDILIGVSYAFQTILFYDLCTMRQSHPKRVTKLFNSLLRLPSPGIRGISLQTEFPPSISYLRKIFPRVPFPLGLFQARLLQIRDYGICSTYVFGFRSSNLYFRRLRIRFVFAHVAWGQLGTLNKLFSQWSMIRNNCASILHSRSLRIKFIFALSSCHYYRLVNIGATLYISDIVFTSICLIILLSADIPATRKPIISTETLQLLSCGISIQDRFSATHEKEHSNVSSENRKTCDSHDHIILSVLPQLELSYLDGP